MSWARKLVLAALALLGLSWASAQAGVYVGVGVRPAPYYRHYYYRPYYGPRVVVGLPPVYIGPAPVVVAPAPVYVAPPPPVVIQAAPGQPGSLPPAPVPVAPPPGN